MNRIRVAAFRSIVNTQRLRFRPEASEMRHFSENYKEKNRAETTLSNVVKSLQSKGHTVAFPDDYANRSVVPVLLRHGLEDFEVENLLVQNVSFLNVSGEVLEPILKVFVQYSIDTRTGVLILVKCPELIKKGAQFVNEQLMVLSHLVRSKITLKQFVQRYPNVLMQDLDPMLKLKTNLGNFFSDKQIEHMIQYNPELLFCDFDMVEKSYEYIYYVMGLEPDKLVESAWHQHRISHIRARHEFALATGTFRKPHRRRPAVAADNPSLKRILDNSDTKFAKICRVGVEEYRMFVDMYEDRFEDDEDLEKEMAETKGIHKSIQMRADEMKARVYEAELELASGENEKARSDDRPDKFVRRWMDSRRVNNNRNSSFRR